MQEVISTAAVGGILLLILVLIIRSMWKKRKQCGSCCGCGSCGGGCLCGGRPSGEALRKSSDRN